MRKITYNNFYEEAAAGVSAEGGIERDPNQLGVPMRGAFTGFLEAKKAYENGSSEVRRLLMDECNLIFECNVCRSMFRSFNNFLGHKRSFCRENSNCPTNDYADHNSVIIKGESSSQILGSKSPSPLPPPSTLAATARTAAEAINICNSLQVPVIIDSSSAVGSIQPASTTTTTTINLPITNHTSVLPLDTVPNMNSEPIRDTTQHDSVPGVVDELTKMLSSIGTTLGPDGKVMPPSEPGGDIKCAACDATFPTDSSLQQHMQKVHSNMAAFGLKCPSCPQTFLHAASVMRHLANDHKKPVRRIRMMRDSSGKRRIHIGVTATKQKGKKMAADLKRGGGQVGGDSGAESLLGYEEATNGGGGDEGDAGRSGPVKKIMSSCIYCDKSFERRAALSTHLLHCRARQEARVGTSVIVKNRNSPTAGSADEEQPPEQREEVAAPEAEAAVKLENGSEHEASAANLNATVTKQSVTDGVAVAATASPALTEPATKSDNSIGAIMKRKSVNGNSGSSSNNNVPQSTGKPKAKKKKRSPLDEAAAAAAGGNGATPSPNEPAAVPCRCKICNKQFNALSNLRRHISMFHYRAQRFGCKLCDYRGFRRYDIVNHLGFVHKMTGERETMSVEYVDVHEVEYSKDDVDADILLLKGDEAEAAVGGATQATPTEKAKTKRASKGKAAAPVATENVAPVADSPDEVKTASATRKSLRRSESHQEQEVGSAKRPIRNRVKPVNKDFVYDTLKNNKREDETAAGGAPALAIPSTPTTTVRTLRRRNTAMATAVDRENETSCSSVTTTSNSSSSELSKFNALLTPSKRLASKGSALRLAVDLVQHGRAKSSTPPELPAERRQWRPQLSSSSREDMQAGPVIDGSDLEAARRKATPLLDDSFLEKMAKRSTPGGFRLKACLAAQPEHSALDTLLQKVDSMQQHRRATPSDMQPPAAPASAAPVTPVATPVSSSMCAAPLPLGSPLIDASQPAPQVTVKEEPLGDHREDIGNFSSYPQTPPPPSHYPYQTSLMAHDSPQSPPMMATVSDFEDDTDDEDDEAYTHSGGTINSLIYPAANANLYDLQQQHLQHSDVMMPSNALDENKAHLSLLQRLGDQPPAVTKHGGNSLLRSALEN